MPIRTASSLPPGSGVSCASAAISCAIDRPQATATGVAADSSRIAEASENAIACIARDVATVLSNCRDASLTVGHQYCREIFRVETSRKCA